MALPRTTEEMPRLVDYFVVCGLKEECLEPDRFGGKNFADVGRVVIVYTICKSSYLHVHSYRAYTQMHSSSATEL